VDLKMALDKFETAIAQVRETKAARLAELEKDRASIQYQLDQVQREIDLVQANLADLDDGLVKYQKGKNA
jgi:septal ring factor EnvC (AmiA/AmiB activator)